MESFEHQATGNIVEEHQRLSQLWEVKGAASIQSSAVRNVTSYIVIIFTCGLIIWLTIGVGKALETSAALTNIQPQTTLAAPITGSLYENLRGPLGILLMQIVVVVLAGRILLFIASRFGQPPVIGEMLAGILLGPSFLGLISPAAMGFLFPPSSMDTLRMFSQVGVILFMFLVGIDLDTEHLHKHVHSAVLVSHASIIFPASSVKFVGEFRLR